jgi:cardiolipin synthase
MNTWKIYTDTHEVWEEMLRQIKKAKDFIYFEQYVFRDMEDGSVGKIFSNMFLKKAMEGVTVKLIIDAEPSLKFVRSKELADLREAGVEVMLHTTTKHPWKNFLRRIFRDHRKIMVVDGEISFTGGIINQNKAKNWRDTHIMFRGPITEHFQKIFEETFESIKSGNFKVSPPKVIDDFKILTNGPEENHHFILNEMILAINNAKEAIFLTSPYFNPPEEIVEPLKNALLRNVDIQVLLPSKSDNPIVDLVTQSFLEKALSMGIKVHLFPRQIHAKSMVIDNDWATIGGANFDRLSLLHNYEINVVSTERSFIQKMRYIFFEDLEKSKKLSLSEWRNRPMTRKFWEKISGILYPIV